MATKEQFDLIKVYGRYNFPPSKMALLLDIPRNQHESFIAEFRNEDSELRLTWEAGKALGEIDTMESLDHAAASGDEGSGDAAKALAYLKHKQSENELKKDLFGL